MPNTKYYLEQIKLESELKELLIKAQSVEVTYNGETMTLAAALDVIYGDISALPTTTVMNAAIQSAIAATGHASFEKVDAVPTVEEAQDNILYLVKNPETSHYDIYAKIKGEDDGDGNPTYTVELLDDTTVDLSGKMDKVTGATAGDIATLDADGAVQDSGKTVGGATLSAAPDANTVATEAAVKDAIDKQATATTDTKGLMSPEDKTRVDTAGAVWVGESAPAGMRNGDLFIRVVNENSEG